MTEDVQFESTGGLIVHSLSTDVKLNSFAQDVLAGLSSTPKTLPPKYFYDRLGSHLFEAITCLPEYYVTRDENEILQTSADEIIAALAPSGERSVRLIELGSGSSEKTRHLIEALFRAKLSVHYVPIDISGTSLRRACEELLRAYPQLKITAYAADFFTALKSLAETSKSELWSKQRNVMLFLGSTIGNLSQAESIELLQAMRAVIYPEDALLIGADLKKSLDVLIPAYNDALGVTAAFNLNVLVRINNELGGNFDLKKFEHRAIYNEEFGRIEMHLYSRAAQKVKIEALNLEVSFEEGESIHTENSYKFETSGLSTLAEKSGFQPKGVWFDSHQHFSLSLFEAL